MKNKMEKPGTAELPNPYVVRFGPWARNLYLGLPVALTFGIIGVIADAPWYFALIWNGVVLLVLWICAFPREVRIYARERIVVVRRFLALIPVRKKSYALSDFSGVKHYHASASFTGEADVAADTMYLALKSGRLIALQSWSSGADNWPPEDELLRAVKQLTGLSKLELSQARGKRTQS